MLGGIDLLNCNLWSTAIKELDLEELGLRLTRVEGLDGFDIADVCQLGLDDGHQKLASEGSVLGREQDEHFDTAIIVADLGRGGRLGNRRQGEEMKALGINVLDIPAALVDTAEGTDGIAAVKETDNQVLNAIVDDDVAIAEGGVISGLTSS